MTKVPIPVRLSGVPDVRNASPPKRRVLPRLWLVACLLALGTLTTRGGDLSLTNLLTEGDLLERRRDTPAALRCYLQADQLFPERVEVLSRLSKQYCDLLHTATNRVEARALVREALACARRAVQADPQSALAHVCLAICYAKNFPYSDNSTKVTYSRQIKQEAETAMALDPQYDLPYHMLGRWNCEVSGMGILLKGLVNLAYGGLPKASREEAIVDFKKAAALSPKRIIHHLQLARLYHLTRQETLSVAELKVCKALSPQDLDDEDARAIALKVLAGGAWPAEF
jgi:tetratricopeptide (TPR) repeat protein